MTFCQLELTWFAVKFTLVSVLQEGTSKFANLDNRLNNRHHNRVSKVKTLVMEVDLSWRVVFDISLTAERFWLDASAVGE